MKKLILLLLIVPMVSLAQIQVAKMTFDKTVHDFGIINEGEIVQTKFYFTNTGKVDLIIVDARGSSIGTTVPYWPKYVPIAPGGSGEILVSFDSSNKPNMQQRSVTINANTSSGRETLRIKARVSPDPAKAKLRRKANQGKTNQGKTFGYKVGEKIYDIPKDEVAGFLDVFPNAIPLFDSDENSKVDQKRGKKRSFKTRDANRVRGEEKKEYKGLGLPQIILILIIVIPLILVIIYFTKSPTKKVNIQHSSNVEPPQEVKRTNFCTNCGTPINNETAFCTNCGSKIT